MALVARLQVQPRSATVPVVVTADANLSFSTSSGELPSLFTFDWGDGSAAEGPAGTFRRTHVYEEPGDYTITVTVIGNLASEDEATVDISVLEVEIVRPDVPKRTVLTKDLPYSVNTQMIRDPKAREELQEFIRSVAANFDHLRGEARRLEKMLNVQSEDLQNTIDGILDQLKRR